MICVGHQNHLLSVCVYNAHKEKACYGRKLSRCHVLRWYYAKEMGSSVDLKRRGVRFRQRVGGLLAAGKREREESVLGR